MEDSLAPGYFLWVGSFLVAAVAEYLPPGRATATHVDTTVFD